MINFVLLKIKRFFYRLFSKAIYLIIPLFSKVFILSKVNSRIINQLNKLRYESDKNDDHSKFINGILKNKKLIALDVGAQGGFFNSNLFVAKYNRFFEPILVD